MSGDSTSPEPWVDRPKPRVPWPVWVLAAAFWVFFVSFPLRAPGAALTSPSYLAWIALSVVSVVAIGWFYFDVRYELGDRTLKARAGPNRAQLEISEIVEVDVTPWYTFVLPRNWGALLMGNSWTPMLRIVDSNGRKLLVTPTNPEEMRDQVLRRRDRLRGDTNA